MSGEKHSLLSPSSSHRWSVCAGSVALSKNIPSKDSVVAKEGKKAHEIAAKVLNDILTKDRKYWDQYLKEVDVDPYIKKYIFCVIDRLGYYDRYSTVKIEQSVDYSKYMPPIVEKSYYRTKELNKIPIVIKSSILPILEYTNDDYKGTADCIITGDDDLHIIDFKYGYGKVEAFENTQLLLYALGALGEYDKVIHLHIVQPRINHYDVWTISRDDLLVWGGYLKARAVEALKPNAPYTPNEKVCKFCRAKAICPALVNTFKTAVEKFQTKGDLDNLSFDHVRYVLDNAKLLKFYIKFMEDTSIQYLENGKNIEGYQLIDGRFYKKLKRGAEEYLSKVYGDKIYKKTLLPYGQMQKLLSPEELELFESVEGKKRLVKV